MGSEARPWAPWLPETNAGVSPGKPAEEPEEDPSRTESSLKEPLRQQLETLHASSFSWALRCSQGDRDQAEEGLQIVYLRLLEGRVRYRGDASFKTFVFGLIRRTQIELGRRRKLHRRLLARWSGNLERDEGRSAENSLQQSERTARIRRALNSLSPRQVQVLDLVFYHHLTLQAAAEAMGIRLGSARVHYERGKRRLREKLQKEM